mgnify:FL=1
MTENTPKDFEKIVELLTRGSDSSTWSIIVTIFGDLAQNPKDEISGSLLSSLTRAIGIKPQAMRVALHRLRRDGWILTTKNGRTSTHRLSDFGRDQSSIARKRIYARTIVNPEKWHMVVANPQTQKTNIELVSNGYYAITPGIFIGEGIAPEATEEFMVIEGVLSNIPNWLKTTIADPGTIQEYSRLLKILDGVRNSLDRGIRLSSLENVIIRILIVHNWRRIVLRQSDLSLEFLQIHSAIQCRIFVWELLNRLSRPALKTLHRGAGNQPLLNNRNNTNKN